jgi:uncharacterized LabA/DUF88 family protein
MSGERAALSACYNHVHEKRPSKHRLYRRAKPAHGNNKSEYSWEIDLARFREYLSRKYNVGKVFYYLGYVQDSFEELYVEIQSAGFILVFRQHNPAMLGLKKGNVDSDIIFSVMKRIYKQEDFDKVLLISGDGDYKILVDFLIEEKRLAKVLFPNQRRASSLYKKIGHEFFDDLSKTEIRVKIGKRKGGLR